MLFNDVMLFCKLCIWGQDMSSDANNLSKGHMIHMVMLLRKHFHNKKQD